MLAVQRRSLAVPAVTLPLQNPSPVWDVHAPVVLHVMASLATCTCGVGCNCDLGCRGPEFLVWVLPPVLVLMLGLSSFLERVV